jgi:hypothetical protein
MPPPPTSQASRAVVPSKVPVALTSQIVWFEAIMEPGRARSLPRAGFCQG